MQSLNHTPSHNHHVKNYNDVSIIYILLLCIKKIIYVFLSPVLKNALYSFVTVLYSKEKTFLVRKVNLANKKTIRFYCFIQNTHCFLKHFLANVSVQNWAFSPLGYISQRLGVLGFFLLIPAMKALPG